MQKGFPILNVLIIIAILALAFFGYREYISRMEKNLNQKQESQSNTADHNLATSTATKTPTNGTELTVSSTTPIKSPTQPTPTSKPTEQTKGFYQNETYHYNIKYPTDWPLRVRSADNISIGTVPPKDGWGAITIEVSKTSDENELNQAKKEAERYAGMVSITEEKYILAGVAGKKVIMKNNLSNTTNIYIILEKYGQFYYLKYSEESTAFVNKVSSALQTFTFTK